MNRRPDWREAFAKLDSASARKPVSLHHPQLLLARGLNAEAVEAYREFLKGAPEHPQALESLGLLLRRMGRATESAAVLATLASVQSAEYGATPDVTRFLAAAEAVGPAPDKAPAEFVTALYDRFADEFESRLVGNLEYRGPAILREAVIRAGGPLLQNLHILDLGCGTGLAGVAFRSVARRMIGVDLSPKMLEKAAEKGVYDELVAGEVVDEMRLRPGSSDLILAADVFVYLGDLAPVFAAARAALRPGGRLAFTVEAAEDDRDAPRLQSVRRYAHSRGYLVRIATAAGLHVELLDDCTTRTESTIPVRSLVAVLRSGGDDPLRENE